MVITVLGGIAFTAIMVLTFAAMVGGIYVIKEKVPNMFVGVFGSLLYILAVLALATVTVGGLGSIMP